MVFRARLLVATAFAVVLAGVACAWWAAAADEAGHSHEVDVVEVKRVDVLDPVAGATVEVEAKCPSGYQITQADWAHNTDDVALLWAAEPVLVAELLTATRYRVVVRNRISVWVYIGVAVTCIEKTTSSDTNGDGKKHKHKLAKTEIRETRVQVEPGAAVQAFHPACKEGWYPTHGTVEAADGIVVERSYPWTRDGNSWWGVYVRNEFKRRRKLMVRTLCAKGSTKPGPGAEGARLEATHTHDAEFSTASKRRTLPSGRITKVSARCPAGSVAVGGGFSSPSDGPDVVLLSTETKGRRLVARFAGNASEDAEAAAIAMCMGKRVR